MYGTSTFTYWESMKQDLTPLPVENRAFGGARWNDLLEHLDGLVLEAGDNFRLIVVTAGMNDLSMETGISMH